MIDCHCHLADERIYPDFTGVLARSRHAGIRYFILGGVSPDEWDRQDAIVADHSDVLPAYGLHPVWVANHNEVECTDGFSRLQKRIGTAAAIGETGLDFRRPYASDEQKAHQLFSLQQHLLLAERVRKPLILHVVQAHAAALGAMKAHGRILPGSGIVHGFTGSLEVASKWLDLGFYISVGTRLLFSQNQRLRDLAALLPVDRLLVESDSPDQRPPNHIGEFNEPWTTRQVIAKIAAVKNIDVGLLQDQVLINAGRLFGREFSRGTGNNI